jgi:hypothetical protein
MDAGKTRRAPAGGRDEFMPPTPISSYFAAAVWTKVP